VDKRQIQNQNKISANFTVNTMKKTLIDFSDTGHFSKVSVDYVNGAEYLRKFYQSSADSGSFKRLISENNFKQVNRELLKKILAEQNKESLDKYPAIKENINSLSSEKTFTVTTGHQLCLFTGPLYFIYKIITTINLAESLKKGYPENNFVPVYWMASEDHDIEEVNHINLFGKKLSWDPDLEGKNIPAGKVKTKLLKGLIDNIKDQIGTSAEAKELILLFEFAYLNHHTLSEATRYLVNELFGKYGIVVIDPNVKELKNQFIPFIKDDIFNNQNKILVEKAIGKLNENGIDAQVKPRQINFFYLKDDNRQRIENEKENFRIISTEKVFTREKLEKEINEHPENFSPNVVTRPLYQQVILPNLAYVGGPGEIAYWLEYKEMFDQNKVNFPILILRNCILWIDEQTSTRIKKMGLSLESIFKRTDDLINSFIKDNSTELILDKEESEVSDIFKKLSEKAAGVDITLKASVEAELQKSLNSLKHIQGKMTKAEKLKQETSINQIRKLKDKLFPEGHLQERHENFIPFYIQNGNEFFNKLKENIDPFSKGFIILSDDRNNTSKVMSQSE
jgi:bacillithiol synthase